MITTAMLNKPGAADKPVMVDAAPMADSTATAKTATITDTTAVSGPGHFRFSDLPTEIRLMIYEHALVVGQVSYKSSVDSEDNWKREENAFRKPDVALLQVCRKFLVEAEKIYLEKNLFVLPINFKDHLPFNKFWKGKTTREPRYLFSEKGLDLIKNVSMNFDHRQISRLVFSALSREHWALTGQYLEQLTTAQRRIEMDEYMRHRARHCYWLVQRHLRMFRSTLNYLEVDFAEMYSYDGITRPFDLCFGSWILTLNPKIFVITGVRMSEIPRCIWTQHVDPTTYLPTATGRIHHVLQRGAQFFQVPVYSSFCDYRINAIDGIDQVSNANNTNGTIGTNGTNGINNTNGTHGANNINGTHATNNTNDANGSNVTNDNNAANNSTDANDANDTNDPDINTTTETANSETPPEPVTEPSIHTNTPATPAPTAEPESPTSINAVGTILPHI